MAGERMNWLDWIRWPFVAASDTQDDVRDIRRVVSGIPAQLRKIERLIMATKQEVLAQLAEADSATNNIAADIEGLKAKLDAALADNQGAIDAAVTASLQEVSDGLTPLVGRLQGVAASTPEDPAPPVDEFGNPL